MNRNIGTNPNRMLGATIRADNRTYGLAPARPAGQPETVADIADPYCLTAITTAARLVAVGDVVFLGGAWREVSRVRRQGFSFLWDFADGKNAIRSQGEFVTVARIALAEAVAR